MKVIFFILYLAYVGVGLPGMVAYNGDYNLDVNRATYRSVDTGAVFKKDFCEGYYGIIYRKRL